MIKFDVPRMSAVPSLIKEREGVSVVPVNRSSPSTVPPPPNVRTVSSTSLYSRPITTGDEVPLKKRIKKLFQMYDEDQIGIEEETTGGREVERRVGSTQGKIKRTRKETYVRDETQLIKKGDIVKEVDEGVEEHGEMYEMVEEMNQRFSNLSGRTSRLSESDFSASRKNNKPQMEKKRRQREKQSLNQLREYVLTAYKVDPSRYMDKAEILEKTAKFMQHIMKKYYPMEEKECSGKFTIPDYTTSQPGSETENLKKQNEFGNYSSTFRSIHQNVESKVVNSSGQFELSPHSRNDQVITFIIPQLGSNFKVSPQVLQKDNCNNYWFVGQPLSDNSSEISTTLTSPAMKLVVNHNYYMNSTDLVSRDAVSTTSEESYSREVLSPDTTTGSLNQYKCLGGQNSSIICPVTLATYPDSISSNNPPIIGSNQRRIAPKVTGNLSNGYNQQFGHNLSFETQNIQNNILHRPWEK